MQKKQPQCKHVNIWAISHQNLTLLSDAPTLNYIYLTKILAWGLISCPFHWTRFTCILLMVCLKHCEMGHPCVLCLLVSTVFLSYHDTVRMWQGTRWFLSQYFLSEISCPRHHSPPRHIILAQPVKTLSLKSEHQRRSHYRSSQMHLHVSVISGKPDVHSIIYQW